MLKIFKDAFILNTLGVFIAFIFASQSFWDAFIDTEKPDEFSGFGYMSILFCLLSIALILMRWKKLKLISHIILILVVLFALQGPVALTVTYIDWFHQFKWSYSS